MMDSNDIQKQFLEKIKDLLPSSQSYVDEIADVLELSNDSAYRRIRGETALTITEISALCNHFKISFDLFIDGTENIPFNFSLLNNYTGFDNYLSSILKDMQHITKTSDKGIIYAAIDIPIFHHFNFIELSAFKMFYWMKAVVNVPELSDKKFSVSHVSEEFANIGKQIYKTYENIPSIEIWTNETINSLIKQIEFYWESGNFSSKEDALTVCNQAKQEIELLEKQAELSNKNIDNPDIESSKFTLYYSDIEIGNNCIFTQKADLKTVYLSVHTFNKIITSNKKFVLETENWLNNLIKKSSLISGVSQKNRYQFFKASKKKIDILLDKIENE